MAEIKTGMIVWCKDNGRSWAKDKREFIGVASNGGYVCWRGKHLQPTMWDEVSATDPHTPKAPDYMPENCELWDKKVDADGFVYYHLMGSTSRMRPDTIERFHSFAVQAGDGTVSLRKTSGWFTEAGIARLRMTYSPGDIDAEILGVVMRKA